MADPTDQEEQPEPQGKEEEVKPTEEAPAEGEGGEEGGEEAAEWLIFYIDLFNFKIL